MSYRGRRDLSRRPFPSKMVRFKLSQSSWIAYNSSLCRNASLNLRSPQPHLAAFPMPPGAPSLISSRAMLAAQVHLPRSNGNSTRTIGSQSALNLPSAPICAYPRLSAAIRANI